MMDRRTGFSRAGIQHSSGGTMGTLPWYRTRPTTIVSPMPAKVEPSWFRPPDAAGPTVGANCRCIEDNVPEVGTSRRGEEDGAIGRRQPEGGRTTLPSFETQTLW